MKLILCVLFSMFSLLTQAQKIFFPAKDLSDSNNYKPSMIKLASTLITLYSNKDKEDYYDDLFRLQFAKQDHKAVIESLDSFDANSKMEKAYYKSYGFHYRIHSMTMLALQKDPSKDYGTTYASIFNTVLSGLPEDAKADIKNNFKEANASEEKEAFIKEAKEFSAAGQDSISLTNAIDLVKQWNYWQVYEKTVSLAKKQINTIDEAIAIKKQQQVMGFEEGAVLSANAQTYFTNVTLVDVEKQKLISNATVGITGSSITSISTKGKTKLPAGATIIDGTGKFLMPGMTDAHVHFSQSGGLYTRPDAINFRKYSAYENEIEWTHVNMIDFLKRYVHAGITGVIDVGSTPNFLKLRDKFNDKSYAPSIYMTGPLLTSYEPDAFKKLGNDEPFSLVTTEEEGRKMVQQELPYHPDFIKIWYIVSTSADKEAAARKFFPTAKAIIDEAHKNNLKVAVHATERITAQLAVEAGCDYLVHSVDDEILSDDILKLFKSRNVILCPTLTVFSGYAKTFAQELDFSERELRWSNPQQVGSLYDMKHIPEATLISAYKNSIKSSKPRSDKRDSVSLVNLKRLMDAGVRIAAGTDAGNIGTMHATSFLAELKSMKRSGISNWQIIQSATINPVYILSKEKESGSIVVGKKADMVLLNANPVDDLDNLDKIDIVINKGFVIKPDTLIKETPLALVQRQLNAYNARNLDAFLEPYANDVELYQFPDKLIMKGKEKMRTDYAFLNTTPLLHCEIKERIIQGNIIIDKESVTGFGPKPLEATAIYHIENNKIKKVYFIY